MNATDIDIDIDIDKSNRERTRFAPPSIDDVQACTRKRQPIALTRTEFVDFYSSKGLEGWQSVHEGLESLCAHMGEAGRAQAGQAGQTNEPLAEAVQRGRKLDKIGVDLLEDV